jgi:hypothetical protein
MSDTDADDDTPTESREKKLLAKARRCYTLGVEALKDQVKRELEDLRCQVPELIWPDDVKTQRAGQVVAGVALPARPMISIPSMDQPVQLVLNNERAAHLGVQIHALSEDADDDTAEVLQGLYRRIEVDSRASLARGWAYDRAVKAGRGAYRILTEYDEGGGHWTDQKIVIKRLLHQEAAVFDPFAQEPDWSDGRWAFVTQWVPLSRYKEQYPDSRLAKTGEHDVDGAFEDMPDETRPFWIKGEGESRAVLVAEYFYLEFTTKTRVLLDDDSDAYDDEIPKGRTPKYRKGKDGKDTYERSKREEVPNLRWVKMNGIEILEEEDRDGRYIPIIPVIGRELQPFDSERRWVGIYGPNKEAARMLNYAASGSIEAAALEPRAPFDVDPEEIEGFEAFYAQANIRNFPYLPRHKYLHGQIMPALQRIQADSSKVQINTILLQQAREFLYQGTGAYKEALGQADPANKTKGGILALQKQHEQGNSHFLDNLAQISITYEAKVILDLIPFYYDRPGRIARILDMEDNAKTVMLNKPFAPGPNKRPVPLTVPGPDGRPIPDPNAEQRVADPNDPAQHYDLKKGRYGVVVSVGKARESRIEEGSEGLGMLFQAEPQLFQILGDIWLKFQTWPGHQEAAERVKKMLPPPLQAEDESAQAKAAQELGQAKQALQQMQQQLQQAGEIIKTDQIKAQADVEKTKVKAHADFELQKAKDGLAIELQKMKDATAIRIKEIDAMMKGIIIDHEAQHEAQALGFEADQAAQTRAHEVGMAEMGHQQALAAGEQAHGQALDQGLQAAALAPPPPNGSGG